MWRYVKPSRSRFQFVNQNTVAAWLGFDRAATANKGAILYASGGAYSEGFGTPGCFQGLIYCIATSGSGNVAIQEW